MLAGALTYEKRLSTYNLDILKLRKFQGKVKNVATVDGLCGYVYQPHWAAHERLRCMVIHICVRPLHSVARSTLPGNAKVSECGSEQQISALTLFFYKPYKDSLGRVGAQHYVMKIFSKATICLSVVAILSVLASCSNEPFSLDNVTESVDNVLTSVNIQDATAVYYKGSDSRAGSESGYFKIDINGNEVKLEFYDAKGKVQDIPINYVVNASPRYLIFQPELVDGVYNTVLNHYGNSTDDWTEEQYDACAAACAITCIVDKNSGKLYKIPLINLKIGDKIVGQNGIYYMLGANPDGIGDAYGLLGTTPSQIYAFNSNNLTVSSLLPEGQQFTDISVNSDGFVAYYGMSGQLAKAKCPGGGIKMLGGNFNGQSFVYTINGTFYTPDFEDRVMKCWTPNGKNDMTSTVACSLPGNLQNPYSLYDQQKGIYLFYANSWDDETIWKFDGTAFAELNATIPSEFFVDTTWENKIYQTADAWYVKKNDMTLLKLAKSDYALTNVDISNYQIIEIVSNESGADLSFTGIRYSDSKKVIGKIKADNSIVIESAITSNENIYNLIPLN